MNENTEKPVFGRRDFLKLFPLTLAGLGLRGGDQREESAGDPTEELWGSIAIEDIDIGFVRSVEVVDNQAGEAKELMTRVTEELGKYKLNQPEVHMLKVEGSKSSVWMPFLTTLDRHGEIYHRALLWVFEGRKLRPPAPDGSDSDFAIIEMGRLFSAQGPVVIGPVAGGEKIESLFYHVPYSGFVQERELNESWYMKLPFPNNRDERVPLSRETIEGMSRVLGLRQSPVDEVPGEKI